MNNTRVEIKENAGLVRVGLVRRCVAVMPLFKLGDIFVTSSLIGVVDWGCMDVALGKHEKGMWGDVSEIEREVHNPRALCSGGYLFSCYACECGLTLVRIWIDTEGDRSRTIVMLPSDQECFPERAAYRSRWPVVR